MAPPSTALLAAAGVASSAGMTVYHLFHILHGDDSQLHGSLSGYYNVLLPYVTVSGAVAAAFFGIFLFPAELSAITGERVLVDVAFLGITLVWIGAAHRIFAAVDHLGDEYFSGGGRDGS